NSLRVSNIQVKHRSVIDRSHAVPPAYERTPNQSLEPTAGRCAAMMKDEVKATLGSACRGLSLSRYATQRASMLPQAIAEPLAPTRDARGFVVEPLSLAQLTAQQNVHVVWTAAGAVRGNHHHVRGTQVALVLGPALVRYKDANGIQEVEISK